MNKVAHIWEPLVYTLAPLSVQQPTECKCMAPYIKAPICSFHTIHQFVWKQHMCGALHGSSCRMQIGRTTQEDSALSSLTQAPPSYDFPKNSLVCLNCLHTSVGRFRSCLYRLHTTSFAACVCFTEKQTVEDVVLRCPNHRHPHGLHGLTALGN